ncbi:MAG: pyridoxal 5'-phosphate synthase glutaminase subunit PdxT [candidate division Zixibacteria bacterium]
MTSKRPAVGLLALQGDYQKHEEVLRRLDVSTIEVHRAEDFSKIDRLIIPGGESTTMLNLLVRFDLEDIFISFAREKPVWGTCAGMILLAKKINNSDQKAFGLIDIDIDRNGYGRQYFSTVADSQISLNGHSEELNLVFIRAPRVTHVGDKTQVLMEWKGDPVLLCQNNILVSSFHPELTGSVFLHDYFISKFWPDA